jgi:FdhD protein
MATQVHIRGAHASVVAPGLTDDVAVEEPLEIRVDGRPLAVTMRTPGHDEELALGFLFGEGLIDRAHPAGPPADFAVNTIEVEGPLLREPDARSFFTSSSCGVCGKGALEQVAVHAEPIAGELTIDRALLADLPNRLRQPTFARTGGLHATGLFTPWVSSSRSVRTSGATTRWTRRSGANSSTGAPRAITLPV